MGKQSRRKKERSPGEAKTARYLARAGLPDHPDPRAYRQLMAADPDWYRRVSEADDTALGLLRQNDADPAEVAAALQARYRLLYRDDPAACFPEVGDALGDFRLLAELGRGALGRVYLATQPHLADRPVVLKAARCGGAEHLSLARLLHTHIVPLYSAQDLPERGLQLLCMPYLGGTSLAGLLAALAGVPPAARTSRHLLDELDRGTAAAPAPAPRSDAVRQRLGRIRIESVGPPGYAGGRVIAKRSRAWASMSLPLAILTATSRPSSTSWAA